MIRFLSLLPSEQIARELSRALGMKGAPPLEGVALTDGRVDTTAPHWFVLTADGDSVLAPHDGTTPEGLRGFDYRFRWYDDQRIARVRAVLERLGAVEAPEHVS